MHNHNKTFTLLILITTLTGLASANYYDLSFRGLTTAQDEVQAGESINISTNLANTAEEPRTDIEVELSIVRDTDKSVVHKEVLRKDVDLAGRELRLIEEDVDIPESVPEGSYSLTVMARDASGIAKAYLSEDLQINNERKISSAALGNQGVFLLAERVVNGDGYTRTYDLPSYGTQGENVLPGSDFTVKFNLENTGTNPISPDADIQITPTYSNEEPLKTSTEDLGTLASQETKEYSFDYNVNNPGTYVVSADIEDSETELVSGQVRLVIAGAGGSITDVANSQDTYRQGETVESNVTIVGPADGTTTVLDAEVAMEVIKGGQTIMKDSKSLDTLPLNPKDYTLSAETPEDLDQYTLKITLGKDDQVYDTYTAEYQELDPERTLTTTGEVKEKGLCFDDGECTKEEQQIGNCYDCRNVDQELNQTDDGKNNQQESGNATLPIIAVLLLLLATVTVYWRWNQ